MPPDDGTNLYKMDLGLSRRVFFPLLLVPIALSVRSMFSLLQICGTMGLFEKTKGHKFLSAPTQPQSHQVEDGSPKGGMWTSPANETITKFCKGDIRPRGQWPKY